MEWWQRIIPGGIPMSPYPPPPPPAQSFVPRVVGQQATIMNPHHQGVQQSVWVDPQMRKRHELGMHLEEAKRNAQGLHAAVMRADENPSHALAQQNHHQHHGIRLIDGKKVINDAEHWKKEYEQLILKNENLEKDLSDLRGQLHARKKEYDKLMERSGADREYADAVRRIEPIVKGMQTENARYRHENGSLHEQLNKKQGELASRSSEIDALKKKLQSSEDEVERLKGLVEVGNRRIDELDQEKRDLHRNKTTVGRQMNTIISHEEKNNFQEILQKAWNCRIGEHSYVISNRQMDFLQDFALKINPQLKTKH